MDGREDGRAPCGPLWAVRARGTAEYNLLYHFITGSASGAVAYIMPYLEGGCSLVPTSAPRPPFFGRRLQLRPPS